MGHLSVSPKVYLKSDFKIRFTDNSSNTHALHGTQLCKAPKMHKPYSSRGVGPVLIGKGKEGVKTAPAATVEHRWPGASAASSHVLKHARREVLLSQFTDEETEVWMVK